MAEPAPASPLQAQRSWIDECYSAGTVTQILARLRAHTDPAAQRAAGQIQANSPTAVTVALRALRQARQLTTIGEVLDQELRISVAALDSRDLVEGIRAQVIDKDRAPRWSPATVAEVTSTAGTSTAFGVQLAPAFAISGSNFIILAPSV